MKILITGATGFVGRHLTLKLLSLGHDIHVLSRDKNKAKKLFPQPQVSVFEWKNILLPPPKEALVGIHGIIHLMGENIAAKRWDSNQKKILKESRVDSAVNLIKTIEQNLSTPLEFFISASAIGIYPVDTATLSTEDTPLGHSFLAELCKMWEGVLEALTKTKRKVIVRTGVILDKSDGALKKMLPPFKLGLGGPIGDGKQMMSWIALDDLINIYVEAATNENYSGIYNGVSSNPVSNLVFTKALGKALHRPTVFKIPASVLKLIFGEMASVILDSQSVVSKRLPERGFHFQYETIDQAFSHIFKNESKG